MGVVTTIVVITMVNALQFLVYCIEGEKEESKKAGLKFNIKKTKIMASSHITSWQIEGEKVEAITDFLLGGLQKSLWMVTAVMKLEDACFLEGKL